MLAIHQALNLQGLPVLYKLHIYQMQMVPLHREELLPALGPYVNYFELILFLHIEAWNSKNISRIICDRIIYKEI